MHEILIVCIIGGIAGWLAAALINSDNDSFLLDIVIGIIGGFIGYKLFGTKLNLTHNIWVNKIITATAGAAILAFVIKLARKVLRTK